jgi:uncharacterized membrane protein YphA (DoxX/SURF4 family)
VVGTCVVLLASAFAAAGISKQRDGAAFRAALVEILPERAARFAAVAVPAGELALAALLVSGIAPRAAGVATFGALAAFSVALVRLDGADCGCFGERRGDARRGVGLARNAALALAAAAIAAAPGSATVGGDAETLLAQVTLAAGLACLWQCAVALAPGGLAATAGRAAR